MKTEPRCILVFFSLMILLGGCKKEDDYVYPPVITEILCAHTGQSGSVSYLETDGGETYPAENGNAVKGLRPDSIYRVYCIYELSAETPPGATLYTFQPILSPDPLTPDRFAGGVKTDPVKPVSVWKSGDYINLSLDILSQDLKKHRFHFVDNGITDEFSLRELNLTLYHDQGGDTEAYYQTVYMSVPLRNYGHLLRTGDLILFKVNTFEGPRTFSLVY